MNTVCFKSSNSLLGTISKVLKDKNASKISLAFCNLTNLRLFSSSSLNVFDRKAKKLHRDWSASQENGKMYDYLKDEVSFIILFCFYNTILFPFLELLSLLNSVHKDDYFNILPYYLRKS